MCWNKDIIIWSAYTWILMTTFLWSQINKHRLERKIHSEKYKSKGIKKISNFNRCSFCRLFSRSRIFQSSDYVHLKELNNYYSYIDPLYLFFFFQLAGFVTINVVHVLWSLSRFCVYLYVNTSFKNNYPRKTPNFNFV